MSFRLSRVRIQYGRRRCCSTQSGHRPIIRISKSKIYRFGDSNVASPVFRDVEWTVNDGESWAVIGSGSGQKTMLLQSLMGHLRIAPPPVPPEGLFPFLSDPPRDPHDCVSLVSFAHRPRSSGGAFYDYTARYGAVRDEDRITLRQSMFGEYDFLNIHSKNDIQSKSLEQHALEEKTKRAFHDLTEKLGLSSLLDLPLVALSNGQTRRARIIKAIISFPELLILDEPLTGLDVNSRPTLLSVLRSLHEMHNPRILMGLRTQDPLPEWLTHVAIVKDGRIITGRKEEVIAQGLIEKEDARASRMVNGATLPSHPRENEGKIIVDMRNVNVGYQGRQVLKNINWSIREGQRWHLQGANGSGKTTLLSLLTGDHPQSYTQMQPASHLQLFSRPRNRIPTPHLRSLIGVVSPELGNAYPRRPGVSVWEVIGTGFDGVFVPGGVGGVGNGVDGTLSEDVRHWRILRVKEVLEGLGPDAWTSAGEGPDSSPSQMNERRLPDELRLSEVNEAFAKRYFVDLSAGEQSIVLLMRALVGRPQLVLLDEVWSGMDDVMVQAARKYLRGDGVGPDQAVVVISHWEDEVPWTSEDAVRKFILQDGNGKEM